MSSKIEFLNDIQFQKLLARRDDVDLVDAALELARDANSQLDFDPVRHWISARAAELQGLIAGASSEREMLELLAQTVAVEHEITGSSAAYESAAGSFLPDVIETRQGIPISLSVLYIGVAQQLGMELTGVAAPMHFLTRLETMDGPLFLDAFSGRRILTQNETVEWLAALTQLTPSRIERSLYPVEPRLIIMRMLTNLKLLYAKQENWADAWLVQNRLLALNPGEYTERRDLAIVALKSDRPGVAVELLNSLISVCPKEDEGLLREQLDEAGRQVARWN